MASKTSRHSPISGKYWLWLARIHPHTLRQSLRQHSIDPHFSTFWSSMIVYCSVLTHREKEPIIYEGDLMDEEGVLDFLTSLEAMDLPDRIEEVNAKILAKIIEETDYVAVLFCKYHRIHYSIRQTLYYRRLCSYLVSKWTRLIQNMKA